MAEVLELFGKRPYFTSQRVSKRDENLHDKPEDPGPSKDEKKLLKFLDSLEKESLQAEKKIKENWDSNLKWYRGQQWMVRDRAPLFMANKIAQIVRKKRAKLTEMKPLILIKARRQGLRTTEGVLQKTIEAGWDEYGMQAILSDLANHLMLYGVGFLHLAWDAKASNGQGDVIPGVMDPRYVHIDPAVRRSQDLDQGSYVWTSTYMTTWEIRQRWPGRGSWVTMTDHSSSDEKTVDRYLKQIFAAWQGGEPIPEAIPRSEIREYWFKDPTIGDDGKPKYPYCRHVIRGGKDVILVDEPNPYYDGKYPFVMIDAFDDPQHPWGNSEIQLLKRLQDAINRIGHLFVENTILTGNTWITADQNALTNTTKTRLATIGAVLIEKAVGRTIERESPPPMPPHMMEFIAQSMQIMDELVGLSDATAAAQGRMEVRSDNQLEGLQQAGEVLLRDTARRIETGLERLGQRWVSRIFQFYTRDRTMAYLGQNVEWETFEFERQKFLSDIRSAVAEKVYREMQQNVTQESAQAAYVKATQEAWQYFTFRITPGSSLASVRANRASLEKSLVDGGYLSRVKFLQTMGYPNPQEEIDAATKEALILGGGGGSGDDSSAIHRAM